MEYIFRHFYLCFRYLFSIRQTTFPILITFIIVLGCFLKSYPQDETPPKVSFGIGGGFGGRGLGKTPYIQNYGIELLKYAGKPQEAWGGGYYSLNEKGEVVEVKMAELGFDGYARLSILNAKQNGWLFNFNYAWARYSYSFDNPPFQFKGYTLTKRNGDMESWAFQVGIGRMWQNIYYLRINGLYYDHYTIGAFNHPVNKNYRREFVENGDGFIVTLSDISANRYAIMPEIGLTHPKNPVELSLAMIFPLAEYAYTEQYNYYQNRHLMSVATASYSNFRLQFTLRLGLSIFNSKRLHNQPRYKSTFQHKQPKTINTIPNSKFSGLSINQSITLQNIYFDLTKTTLLPESYSELDELVQWMSTKPTLKIRLEGHTDKIGDADKNLQLSRDRVNVVREYLMTKGISGTRIEVKGYGHTRLLCPSPCERNRRVEMVITKW